MRRTDKCAIDSCLSVRNRFKRNQLYSQRYTLIGPTRIQNLPKTKQLSAILPFALLLIANPVAAADYDPLAINKSTEAQTLKTIATDKSRGNPGPPIPTATRTTFSKTFPESCCKVPPMLLWCTCAHMPDRILGKLNLLRRTHVSLRCRRKSELWPLRPRTRGHKDAPLFPTKTIDLGLMSAIRKLVFADISRKGGMPWMVLVVGMLANSVGCACLID